MPGGSYSYGKCFSTASLSYHIQTSRWWQRERAGEKKGDSKTIPKKAAQGDGYPHILTSVGPLSKKLLCCICWLGHTEKGHAGSGKNGQFGSNGPIPSKGMMYARGLVGFIPSRPSPSAQCALCAPAAEKGKFSGIEEQLCSSHQNTKAGTPSKDDDRSSAAIEGRSLVRCSYWFWLRWRR